MKKIIFNLILLIGLTAHSQSINVSTGIDNVGNALAVGATDPNWQIIGNSSIPAPIVCDFINPNWQPTPVTITNAGWINDTGFNNGANSPFTYTFERSFTVAPSISSFSCNFKIGYDDQLLSFELVKPDDTTIPITVVSGTNVNLFSSPITDVVLNPMPGTWKIRAVVHFLDNYAGFLLSGDINISTIPCDKWSLCGNAATATDFIGTTNTNPLNFKVNNVERMQIDATGTVRIGNVATPSGYKLYVEQGILTEKVKVAVATSPAWADYVFASNYNLKPLSEVEAYVKENKHLPNVPSAAELVKDGLDLGKMQATQMEKIEELTLYMIEMKKEIETLKKENQSLKTLVTQSKN